MKLFKKSLTIFFLLAACCASHSWAQPSPGFRSFSQFKITCAEQEKRHNEFAYSGEPDGIFYCNSLTLEGLAFNYNAFGLESRGELKLIKGESKSYKTVEIPFYLRLRRNGIPVPLTCGEDVIYSKVEISIILKGAQDGDELIVEPVNKEDWPAKRIIKIGDKC
jgi:hypothetical protein